MLSGANHSDSMVRAENNFDLVGSGEPICPLQESAHAHGSQRVEFDIRVDF